MFGKLFLRLALVATAVVPLAAQNTDIEALAGVQFNFNNPGARSLGMGGAFLGLADDASAAEANPAGLTILRKPEVSIEARNFRVAQNVAVSGTLPNIQEEEFSAFSRAAEISFASLVYPVGNFAIAAYFHRPIRYENGVDVRPVRNARGELIQQVPNFFITRGNPAGTGTIVSRTECAALQRIDNQACTEFANLPFQSAVSVDLKTMGLSGAWKIGKFSIGAGLRYQQFREGAFTERFDFNGNPVSTAVQATFDENFDVQYEDAITGIAGFKWTPNDYISFGGVYKQGAEYDAPLFVRDFTEDRFRPFQQVKFQIPDVAGLGVSVKPLPVLTINLDGNYIQYSTLTDSIQPTSVAIAIQDKPYESKDVVELRIGAEYFFTTKIPVAIRAGYWIDPAHSITYVGETQCTDSRVREDQRSLCSAIRTAQGILFPERQDENHYSIGVGLAWPRFQIDAAYDTSESNKVGSLSMVTRF